MKLFLTGFMGAGKSAVGSRLAASMGMDFVDLDSEIENRTGMPVPAVFATGGEELFRQLEHETLRELCASDRDLVIATGGGTPAFGQNLTLMRASGSSVWLDTSFELILARLDGAERSRRPLFGSEADARALFEVRQPAYAKSDVRLRPEAGESPSEIASEIVAALEGRARSQP